MIKAKKFLIVLVLVSLLSSSFGFIAGTLSGAIYYKKVENLLSSQFSDDSIGDIVTQEEAVVSAVEKASPAVVSIIISKDVPILEKYYYDPFGGFFEDDFLIPQYRQKGTEKQEVGGGTGFIISKDGMLLTNKHVVLDDEAEYTVFLNDGRKFPAKVLAKDPIEGQDIALIEIESEKESFPFLELGESSDLKTGQTVIAIGNSLGKFQNTVSVGVISGLERTVTAEGQGIAEVIRNVIQTDAAINKGNSGGPLLNIRGEVIGINTAIVQGAQNIGFAIPINRAKRDIDQFNRIGEIVYPFLGIYYTTITPELKEEHDLPVDYGAWIGRNDYGEETEVAIFPDSAAEKAGLKKDDIILEFDGIKIDSDNPLAETIWEYSPGDNVKIKILREGEEIILEATLDRFE